MGWFTGLSLAWKAVTLLGSLATAAAVLWGVYASIDNQGYQRATQEWTIKYERREAELKQQLADELDRQASINAMAKAAEEAELEDYRIKLEQANKLAIQLADEAAADPNQANVAFDAAAVERHNRRIN